MQKIAVACEGEQVTGHFGHCQNFWIYTVEDGRIIAEENVPNPGHKPHFLPNFLADRGVTVTLTGGMGGGAMAIFQERGVEAVTGATGPARQAVERYLSGELVSRGVTCNHHGHGDHGHGCGGHGDHGCGGHGGHGHGDHGHGCGGHGDHGCGGSCGD